MTKLLIYNVLTGFLWISACSGWVKQPLSTLSASIEHPLGTGGNQEASQQKVNNESFIDVEDGGAAEGEATEGEADRIRRE